MTAAKRRLAVAGAAGVAIVAAAVLALTGGSTPYVLNLRLANASGLREGGSVVVGGVPAGKIKSLKLDRADHVRAVLELDAKAAPVGRDASAAIAAENLLGQKQVQILPGDRTRPAPSGFTMPPSRVERTTDLDQVLDVLDPTARARLRILLNEAGAAVLGRQGDINDVIAQMAPGFADASRLLGQLVGDNHTLARAVTNSSAFISSLNARRADVNHLVDVGATTTRLVAARHAELQQTLARAPQTLHAAQGFLAKLQTAARPLGPAAVNLQAAAPALSDTLAQLEPFRRAAAPALKTATAVAPALSRLSVEATPVLRRAAPTLGVLADVSAGALPPVTKTLDGSIDNVLAVMDNWSRAIGMRDGLSHVFRGEASLNPDVVRSMVERYLSAQPGKRGSAKRPGLKLPKAPAPVAAAPGQRAPKLPVDVPAIRLPQIKLPPVPPVKGSDGASSVNGLLDYLLGK
jgi:virulence factor Mce-like protein